MAILNYGNQFKYSGKGYIDSKMTPVNSVDELEKSKSILSSQYVPGMKVTVLNDGDFGAVEYFLNENYEWKRLVNIDSLTLSLDKGQYDSDTPVDYLLQIHYTNANGDLVALGDALDLSSLLEDVEKRLDILENREPETEPVEDTNTYVVEAKLVTEKEGENGLFMEFVYNDGKSFFSDITALEPKTYEAGVGLLIGEDNIIDIDADWFDSWFEEKIVVINEKISILESEVVKVNESLKGLNTALETISGRIDKHDSDINVLNSGLASALEQISSNASVVEEVKSVANEANERSKENETKVVTLAEQLAKIRGVEYIKAGDNVTIAEEDGYKVISVDVPEIDMSEIEGKIADVEEKVSNLDNTVVGIEEIVSEHTSEISSIQEAIKNLSPEGEGLSGDNVTIKANDNGALSVMISEDELNIIKKNSDGIFAQGIEIVLGDDEINNYEN